MRIILSGYILLKILPIDDSRSADPGDPTSLKQWACRVTMPILATMFIHVFRCHVMAYAL
jgi:hypothetical protein